MEVDEAAGSGCSGGGAGRFKRGGIAPPVFAQEDVVSDLPMAGDMYSITGDGVPVTLTQDEDGGWYLSKSRFTQELVIEPADGTMELQRQYYNGDNDSWEWETVDGALRITENGAHDGTVHLRDSQGNVHAEFYFYCFIGPKAEFGTDYTITSGGEQIAAPTVNEYGGYGWPQQEFTADVAIEAEEGFELFYRDFEAEPEYDGDGNPYWPSKPVTGGAVTFSNGKHDVDIELSKSGVQYQTVSFYFWIGDRMEYGEQYTLSCGDEALEGVQDCYNGEVTLQAAEGYDLYVYSSETYKYLKQESGKFTLSGEEGEGIDFYVVRKTDGHQYFAKWLGIWIDREPPTASMELWYFDGEGDWHGDCSDPEAKMTASVYSDEGPAAILISAQDEGDPQSGVKKMSYVLMKEETDIKAIPEDQWTSIEGDWHEVTLMTGCKNYLYVKVSDRAGNETVCQSAEVAVYSIPETGKREYAAHKEENLGIPLERNGRISKVEEDNEIESITVLEAGAADETVEGAVLVEGQDYRFDTESSMLELMSGVFTDKEEFRGIRVKYGVPYCLSDCDINTEGWVQDIYIEVCDKLDVTELKYTYVPPIAVPGGDVPECPEGVIFVRRDYNGADLNISDIGKYEKVQVWTKYYDKTGHVYERIWKPGEYTVKFDIKAFDADGLCAAVSGVGEDAWIVIAEYPLAAKVKSEVWEYYTDYDDAEEIWNRGDVTLSMEGYTLSSDDEGIRTEDGGKTLILSKGADADGSFRFRLDCQSELSEESYQLPLTINIDNVAPKLSAKLSGVTDSSADLAFSMNDVGHAYIELCPVDSEGEINWDDSKVIEDEYPIAEAETEVSYPITGLSPNTRYAVIVNGYDKARNWSEPAENSKYDCSYYEIFTTAEKGSSGEDKPGSGDNTGGDKPGSGDNTGGNQPGSGDNTGGNQPGSGDNTGGNQPGSGDNTGGNQPGSGGNNGATGGSTGGGVSSGGSTGSGTGGSSGSAAGTQTVVRPDGTKVETTTEATDGGGRIETVTETKPDGAVTVTTTTTQPDGSARTVVEQTETNQSGKKVAVTETTERDADGKIVSKTKASVIADAAKDTRVTVTVVTDASQKETAAAEVVKAGKKTADGKVNGTISSAVVRQIKESAGTSDVTIAQTVTGADGEPRYTVEVNARDLSAGSKLKIMKMDAKTGEYVLCNAKDYKVSASGGVSLSLKTKGTFVLLNESDAKAASDAILKTVQVKDTKKTVKAGKTAKLVLSSALNMKNVSGITYTVSDKSVAKVDKNGKVTAKKSGTVTVRAKVTLKNGRTKTVKMTVKVQ